MRERMTSAEGPRRTRVPPAAAGSRFCREMSAPVLPPAGPSRICSRSASWWPGESRWNREEPGGCYIQVGDTL